MLCLMGSQRVRHDRATELKLQSCAPHFTIYTMLLICPPTKGEWEESDEMTCIKGICINHYISAKVKSSVSETIPTC